MFAVLVVAPVALVIVSAAEPDECTKPLMVSAEPVVAPFIE